MQEDDMQTRIWAQFVRPSRNSESDKRTNNAPIIQAVKPKSDFTSSTKLSSEQSNALALISGDAGGAYSAFSESRNDSGSLNSKDSKDTASLKE